MPRLTIAIPTVNRAELLGRAIESALAQTSTDIEILVSDNGSTDGTPAIIESYAKRGLPVLRTFRHSGVMSASRHGHFLINEARGEFFLGLSDDDFLEPDFAAEVLAAYDRHPETSFVYTGCAVHYGDIQVPALVGPPLESGADFLANHYAGKREVSWCACVTRVQQLREIGPQPDNCIIGDMFFWTKLAFRGPVGCVPRVLSHYDLFRPDSDNTSLGTSPIAWTREERLLADEVISASERAGASPEYLAKLRKDCTQYVARTTANQFAWTRTRGARVRDALKWSIDCVRYVIPVASATARLGAAVMLPRKILKSEILKAAARLSASRRKSSAVQPDPVRHRSPRGTPYE